MPSDSDQLVTLDELRPLMGTIPDAEIARRAGVGRWAVGQYRRTHSIDAYKGHLFESSGGEAPEAAAAKAARPAPTPRQPSRIDPYRDLLGTVVDREIAAMAGVGVSAVTQYRTRLNIPALGGGRRRAAQEAPAAPAPAPEPVVEMAPPASTADEGGAARQRRRSKLDPFWNQLGRIPDAEMATIAGVTTENVRSYRVRHGIAALWKAAPAPEALAPAPAPVAQAAVVEKPAAPAEKPVVAAPAPAPAPAPLATEVRCFAVSVDGMDFDYFIVAEHIGAAALRALQILETRHPGAQVTAVRYQGPALG